MILRGLLLFYLHLPVNSLKTRETGADSSVGHLLGVSRDAYDNLIPPLCPIFDLAHRIKADILTIVKPDKQGQSGNMKNESLGSKWLKFFAIKDKIGKILFGVSVIILVSWFLSDKQSMTFLLVAVGSILFSLLFSFLSYLTVGKYRENAEYKFYDAIAFSCDLPRGYSNKREMRRVKVKWGFLRPKSIKVLASTNSSVGKRGTEWRNVKLSIEDSFKVPGENIVTIFDNHVSGRLDFLIGERKNNGDLNELKEVIYSLTYESFGRRDVQLPRINYIEPDRHGRNSFERLEIETFKSLMNFENKGFEKSFRQRYETDENILVFTWNGTVVTITSILKDSEEAKTFQATKAIENLIVTATSNAFMRLDRNDYIIESDEIDWSANGEKLNNINVNYLHSDMSQQERKERFENLIIQGLAQLYPTMLYELIWSVNPYETILSIQAKRR